MNNMKDFEQEAMKIIAYAGSAKSSFLMALKEVKIGNFEKSEKLIEDGQKKFQEAHDFHRGLFTMDAKSLSSQVSLLLMHAEDQLMSTETTKFLVNELIEMIKSKGGK